MLPHLRWIAFVVLGTLANVVMAQTGSASPVLQLADVFHLQHVADVQISPDEQHIAYVRIHEDIRTDRALSQIWLIDIASGHETLLTTQAASSPRWSPDGQRLAYLASDAAGNSEIHVHSLHTGADLRLRRGKQAPSEISWSPDGLSISFVGFIPEAEETFGTLLPKPPGATWAAPPRVTTAVHYQADSSGELPPGHVGIFIIPSRGGSARLLNIGSYRQQGTPSWTPDSKHLLFTASRVEQDSNAGADPIPEPIPDTNIFDLRLSDGTVTQLTHRKGPDQQPAASPDGNLIAYTGFDERGRDYEETKLYLMNRDGTHPRILSSNLDRDVFQFTWSPDGRGVYALYDDHGDTRVALIDLSGHIKVVASGLDGEFSIGTKGSLAFPMATADHPAEVAIENGSGAVRQLTQLNTAFLKGKDLGKLKPLPVSSSYDGESIGAWMLLPPHYAPGRRYPTILAIHGGPYGDFNPVWSTSFELYAAAGYVVLYANERGSLGYGNAFSQQIFHDFPGHDL